MRRGLTVAALGAFILTSSCGGARTRVLTEANNVTAIEQVALKPVKIESTNLGRDAVALDQQLKAFTTRVLKSQLADKNISTSAKDAAWEIESQVSVFNPDRARYFGGAGRIQITLTLNDKTGARYATTTEGSLGVGWFDSSVAEQAQHTIHAGVEQFVARLRQDAKTQ